MGKIVLRFLKVLFLYAIVSAYGNVLANTIRKDHCDSTLDTVKLSDSLNLKISPFTGFTRNHWLEITEKIISGALPYLKNETGLPVLPGPPGDTSYEKLRDKNPGETQKRALERIMMAVVIYTKATGKDQVPGYDGSISEPFIKAIIRGTDPNDSGYWGDQSENDQVGSVFAMAAYIEPERYWTPLTPEQKNNLLSYFRKSVYLKTYNNNHLFFHMVPVELLEQYGIDSNREHLTKMYELLMGWYRGDGWFLDGSNCAFDYYNLWGFQLFNQVLYKYDPKWRKQFGDRIEKTTAEFMKTLPWLFGRDGGPIPFGRSLSYRFAGNAAIAWSVINGMCTLPPGQARRIASGSLKYFWEHGCLGENHLLNIGYWGANASIAESYLYYGDPYWANQGLACLLIPENNPFWTAVEEPIPADGAGGKLAVPGAQFTIRISPIDGEGRLFPVGQPFAMERKRWQTGAKYDQHGYSSYLGFCVLGEDGPDIGAGRSGYSFDGTNWFYRERSKSILVGNDHLISSYSLKPVSEKDSIPLGNGNEIITHTIVGIDGEIYIFWHNYPSPIYMYLGGYGISVNPDQKPDIEKTKDNILLHGGNFYSVMYTIQAPEGKLESNLLIPGNGWNYTHLFGGEGAYPCWNSSDPVPPHIPLIFYVNGTRGRKPVIGQIKVIKEGGEMKIRFEEYWYRVQIPS
jgi:hypothetical protein